MEKYGIFETFKIIWACSDKKDKFYLIILAILNLIRTLTPLVAPLVLSCIVAKISNEPAFFIFFTFPESMSTISVIAICFGIYSILCFLESSIRALLKLYAAKMTTKLNTYALDFVLEPRKNTKLNLTDGEVNYIIKNASENIAPFIENFFIKFIVPIISAIIAIVYIASMNVITLPILIVTLILLAACVIFRMVKDKKVYKNIENINGKISNNSLNVIENLPMINFIKSRYHEIKISKSLNDEYYRNEKTRINTYILYWLMVGIVEFACVISIFFVVLNAEMTTAELVSATIILITYLLKIFDNFTNLGFILGTLQQEAIKVCRINKIIPLKKELIVETNEHKLPKKIVINKIHVKDLSITIGEINKQGLQFSFYKNKLNCIVGRSGSGKTTVINYLLGLKEYQNGEIIVNDKYNIRSFFFENERFAITLQDNTFFDRSVVENIMYPELELNKKAERLIKYFGVEDLIKRNYYYELNKADSTFKTSFSGGEKRRINLIKCLSKNAQVYIFDEPTNDLDSKNIDKFVKVVEKLKKKAVVIVITHDRRLVDIAENVVKI